MPAPASDGANVVADCGVALDGSDPSSEVAEAVVAEIVSAGGSAVALAGDVRSFDTGDEIVAAACDSWGTIDGVVCAAGSLVGFTSGAFSASTAQANYSAAKGGIVSLTRSAAMTAASIGLRGGSPINANCIAPVARTRMSENVPFEIETGDADDVAPMVVYLLSDAGRDVNGQIYTVVGRRISVWNQPCELRSMSAPGNRWTPAEIAAELTSHVGQEPNPMIADLERRMAEMASDPEG